MSSYALREIDHVPEHPRWCTEGPECDDFTPQQYMYAEHFSEPVSFNASGDDKKFSVSTVRVDTGELSKDGLAVQVGHTEVQLLIRDTGSLCPCGRDMVVAARLDRDDLKHLANLLTAHDELALARRLLDIEKNPL